MRRIPSRKRPGWSTEKWPPAAGNPATEGRAHCRMTGTAGGGREQNPAPAARYSHGLFLLGLPFLARRFGFRRRRFLAGNRLRGSSLALTFAFALV